MRLCAALDGLRIDGAILQASMLGKPSLPGHAEQPPVVNHSRDVELDGASFPALPEGGPARAPIKAPRPPARPARAEEEDAASTAASTAATAPAVCTFCKRPGHVARCKGTICCPLLASKEEARVAAEAAKAEAEGIERLERARDRAMARRLRQHDAEQSGWSTVGKAPTAAAAADPPAYPLTGAAQPAADELLSRVTDGASAELLSTATASVTDGAAELLSRAQKRMQRRKEKSRAKRAKETAP